MSPTAFTGLPRAKCPYLGYRHHIVESNGKLSNLFILSKIATLVPEFTWKTCLWAELQPWCLCYSERPVLGQNTLMMMIIIIALFCLKLFCVDLFFQGIGNLNFTKFQILLTTMYTHLQFFSSDSICDVTGVPEQLAPS